MHLKKKECSIKILKIRIFIYALASTDVALFKQDVLYLELVAGVAGLLCKHYFIRVGVM